MTRLGPVAMGAALCLGALGVLGAVGPALVAGDPFAIDVAQRLAPPISGHPLGQDPLGRDVLARLLLGARISLLVSLSTVGISLVVGVTLGALAALGGRLVDETVARIVDIVLAFPGLLLAIALAAILGPSLGNVIAALALLGWTGYARVTRAEFLALRTRPFVEAARALGGSPLYVAARHLLPLAAPALLVQATFGLSATIGAEASLSFLGLGVPPPMPSWGAMLDDGREFLLVAPHLVVFPGVALAGTVLALQLLGDGLRDALDVHDDPRR